MTSVIGKNSARICPKHRNPIHYINIFENTNKPLSCLTCAREKGVKLEGIFPFNEFLMNEENSDFLINFPPLEKSVHERLIQV